MKTPNEKLLEFIINQLKNDMRIVIISVDPYYSRSIEISSNTDKLNTEKIFNLGIDAFNGDFGNGEEITSNGKIRDA